MSAQVSHGLLDGVIVLLELLQARGLGLVRGRLDLNVAQLDTSVLVHEPGESARGHEEHSGQNPQHPLARREGELQVGIQSSLRPGGRQVLVSPSQILPVRAGNDVDDAAGNRGQNGVGQELALFVGKAKEHDSLHLLPSTSLAPEGAAAPDDLDHAGGERGLFDDVSFDAVAVDELVSPGEAHRREVRINRHHDTGFSQGAGFRLSAAKGGQGT